MTEVGAAPGLLPIVRTVRSRTVAIAVAVVAAAVLPQAFHLLGMAMGVGPGPAQALLPMHLPVLLVGLLAGPVAGTVTGLVSPLLAFWWSGMPAVQLLPFMVLELAAYGLVAGLLAGRRGPVVWKVLAAQIVGRLVRLIAIVVALYGFGVRTVLPASVGQAVVDGWPGILLQLCLIPLVVGWLERRHDDAGR